ncbi:MAG TPA: uroporphyrinogen-III synthase [Vineibacter sp.]|nr:uroporphyrinogen-III synthase [Vineibacter sp.]
MRVLVTRPESEARSFAEALSARGHEPLLAPMLRIEPQRVPEDLAERLAAAQAILLTSANGARLLAQATKVRGYRIFAVGDATAGAARQLGFSDVVSASGDSQALIGMVSRWLSPAEGRLIHAGGAVKAGDIATTLRSAGFAVDEVVLYAMREADALPPDIVRVIEDGRLDAVTFFSPRTAQAFVKLAAQTGIAPFLACTVAVAISPAALAGADGIPWRTRIAARAPTQDGVLASLDAVTPSRTGSPTMSDDNKKSTAPETPAPDTPADHKPQTSGGSRTDDIPEPAVADSATAMPPPAPQPRRGVGVVGAFVSGLVASIVVLGGAVAIYMAQPQAVRQLFASSAKDAGGAPVSRDSLAAALKPLDEKLRQLEAKAGALDAVTAQAAQLKELQAALAAQQTRLTAMQDLAAKVDGLGKSADVDAAARVASDLAQARQTLAALQSDLATLKSRQETAETTIRSLTAHPPSTAGTADNPSDASRQVAVLMERLDRLEKREAQVSGTLSGAVDSAALARAIGEAEARQRDQLVRNAADIERARAMASGLTERLSAVEKDVTAKLDAVRKDVAARSEGDRRAGDNGRAAAAIGISARLRQAIDAGGPFAADADLLKPLAAGDTTIAAIQTELAPFASAGVVTRRILAAEFPEIARRVIAADIADDSWGERLWGKLKQLVSIRRVGDDAPGATPEAIVARAEAALDAGDVAKAVTEMKTLKSPAGDPARDWLARAEAHLAAQRAIDRLSLHSIGLLSRVDSPSSAPK